MLRSVFKVKLEGRKIGKTLYAWGQVGKVPIVIGTILVPSPFPMLIRTIHDIKTSKSAIIPMYKEVWVSWKANKSVRLDTR